MERYLHIFGLWLGLDFFDWCTGFPVDRASGAAAFVLETWTPLLSLTVLLSITVLFLGCVCCRRDKGFQEFTDSTSSHNLAQTGAYVNNAASSTEFTIFPPIASNTLSVSNATTPGDHSSIVHFEPLPDIRPPQPYSKRPAAFNNALTHGLSANEWFENPQANFPRHQLKYLRELGNGWFGRVVEGEAQNIVPGEKSSKVVVKILHEDATATDQMYFLHEVKPYRELRHPHVLRLLGHCLETDPFLVLLEACPSGDLKSFLSQNISTADALNQQGVTLQMACHVASGLQHMHSKGFVHTDLAARNCLVTSDLGVKIGDYGNSIEIFKEDYYCAGDIALPIRWCAPETLVCSETTIETKEVTPMANVWSLGVLMWEICEFGKLPYNNLSDDEVIVKVLGEGSYQLSTPSVNSPHRNSLYLLMKLCWSPLAFRPQLDQVVNMLNHLNTNRGFTVQSDEDFERRWESFKPNTIPKTDNHTVSPKEHSACAKLPVSVESGKLENEKLEDAGSIQELSVITSEPIAVSPQATSPQPSLASSSGGDYFTTPLQQYQKSPSLQNLHGSLDDLCNSSTTSTVKSGEVTNLHMNIPNDELFLEKSRESGKYSCTSSNTTKDQDFETWLQGVETTSEEDAKFVRKISEAIRDLDNALALEKTSSSSSQTSSNLSSHQQSPSKDIFPLQDENVVLDFRLQSDNTDNIFDNYINSDMKDSQFDSLSEKCNTTENKRTDSGTDTEDETWRKRIERGEFSEKVKEKSKSIADLMVLTHIDCSDGSDSEPASLTWTIDKTVGRNSFSRQYKNSYQKANTLAAATAFGSESNIQHAVLGEELKDKLLKFQEAKKERCISDGTLLSDSVSCGKLSDEESQTNNNESLKKCTAEIQVFDDNFLAIKASENMCENSQKSEEEKEKYLDPCKSYSSENSNLDRNVINLTQQFLEFERKFLDQANKVDIENEPDPLSIEAINVDVRTQSFDSEENNPKAMLKQLQYTDEISSELHPLDDSAITSVTSDSLLTEYSLQNDFISDISLINEKFKPKISTSTPVSKINPNIVASNISPKNLFNSNNTDSKSESNFDFTTDVSSVNVSNLDSSELLTSEGESTHGTNNEQSCVTTSDSFDFVEPGSIDKCNLVNSERSIESLDESKCQNKLDLLSEHDENNVMFGPFEECTLDYFKGVTTTTSLNCNDDAHICDDYGKSEFEVKPQFEKPKGLKLNVTDNLISETTNINTSYNIINTCKNVDETYEDKTYEENKKNCEINSNLQSAYTSKTDFNDTDKLPVTNNVNLNLLASYVKSDPSENMDISANKDSFSQNMSSLDTNDKCSLSFKLVKEENKPSESPNFTSDFSSGDQNINLFVNEDHVCCPVTNESQSNSIGDQPCNIADSVNNFTTDDLLLFDNREKMFKEVGLILDGIISEALQKASEKMTTVCNDMSENLFRVDMTKKFNGKNDYNIFSIVSSNTNSSPQIAKSFNLQTDLDHKILNFEEFENVDISNEEQLNEEKTLHSSSFDKSFIDRQISLGFQSIHDREHFMSRDKNNRILNVDNMKFVEEKLSNFSLEFSNSKLNNTNKEEGFGTDVVSENEVSTFISHEKLPCNSVDSRCDYFEVNHNTNKKAEHIHIEPESCLDSSVILKLPQITEVISTESVADDLDITDQSGDTFFDIHSYQKDDLLKNRNDLDLVDITSDEIDMSGIEKFEQGILSIFVPPLPNENVSNNYLGTDIMKNSYFPILNGQEGENLPFVHMENLYLDPESGEEIASNVGLPMPNNSFTKEAIEVNDGHFWQYKEKNVQPDQLSHLFNNNGDFLHADLPSFAREPLESPPEIENDFGLDAAKHSTPDDERSSDSGFRDKGSLSESCEDACDEKYNLEDIEAELEETFPKGNIHSENKDTLIMNQKEYNFHNEQKQSDKLPDPVYEISTGDQTCANDSEPFVQRDSRECFATLACESSSSVHKNSIADSPNCFSVEETLPASYVDLFPNFETSKKNEITPSFEAEPYFPTTKNSAFEALTITIPNDAPMTDSDCLLTATPDITVASDNTDLASDFGNLSPIRKSGWFLHPQESEDSENILSPTDMKLDRMNDEFVEAIRNELQEKLPCAQQRNFNENFDDESLDLENDSLEERSDIIIHYNVYPVPLSPILEERESVSSITTSFSDAKDLKDNSDSELSSPVFILESSAPMNNAKAENFEAEIREALENYSLTSTSEATSDKDQLLLEDLDVEHTSKQKNILKIRETNNLIDEDDDLLVVDTETHEVAILESPKPKSHLAFIHKRTNEELLKIDSLPSTTNDSAESTPVHSCSKHLALEENPSNNSNEEHMLTDCVSGSTGDAEGSNFTADSISPSYDWGTRSSLIGGSSSTLFSAERESMSDFYMTPSDRSPCIEDNSLRDSPQKECKINEPTYEDVEKISICLPNNEAEDILFDLRSSGILDIDQSSKNMDQFSQTCDIQPTDSLDTEGFSAGDSSESCGNTVLTPVETNSILDNEYENNLVENKPAELPLLDKSDVTNQSVEEEEVAEKSPVLYLNDTFELYRRKHNSSEGQDWSVPCLDASALSTKAPMPSPEEESWKQIPSMLVFSDIGEKGSQNEDFDEFPHISFTGPSYSLDENEDHLMSTSFSLQDGVDEGAECYTPDWESESDTNEDNSSSSGEFIWKEGDRESSLKAVDIMDTNTPSKLYEGLSEFPMEMIAEEEEDDDDDDDDDGDGSISSGSGTEFVPSAWNSEAIPSRSALRSPDKKSEQKKNVSFKKQKYHCVYEYPKEISDSESEDSPTRKRWDMFQPEVDYASYADWELMEGDVEQGVQDIEQENDPTTVNSVPQVFDFYKLSNMDYDFGSNIIADDGEFYISSSARPFQFNSGNSDIFATNSSEFFPGQLYSTIPNGRNLMPDSLDSFSKSEVVSANSSENEIDTSNLWSSKSLKSSPTISTSEDSENSVEKTNSEGVHNKSNEIVEVESQSNVGMSTKTQELASVLKQENPVHFDLSPSTPDTTPPSPLSPSGLGELRHTRDKLKLDLPAKNTNFHLDPPLTGKRRSVEIVKGEASLLDSGEDTEDSGVESSNGRTGYGHIEEESFR